LTAHFADVLSRLIPGDFYGVSVVIRRNHEQDIASRHTTISPLPSNWETLAETFASQYSKFPLRTIRESGDLHRPLALSDVASRTEVEGLDLFHDYYRALGVADDLSINFGNLSHRVCLGRIELSWPRSVLTWNAPIAIRAVLRQKINHRAPAGITVTIQ
jgi:hypothetical protein